MSEFRKVTDDLSVAPQIAVADVARAAAEGFRLVINNRPDGEEPGQPTSAQIEAAAKAAGLDYVYAPLVGRPSREVAETVREAVDAADGKALLFCRSGTRSINAWALGQALAGKRSRDELLTVVAHDLRTPIQILNLSTAILKRDAKEGGQALIDRMAAGYPDTEYRERERPKGREIYPP